MENFIFRKLVEMSHSNTNDWFYQGNMLKKKYGNIT